MKTEHEFPHFEARRAAILREALPLSALDGWNAMTLKRATKAAGLQQGTEVLTCPGGVVDLLQYWSFQVDNDMMACLEKENLATLKVREKVALAVRTRLQLLKPHKEAARRARARLAMPDACFLSGRLIWATSDAIWRALGDRSTDGNYYSKRAVLSGVYASTAHVWLFAEDEAEVWAFLERRVEGVMRFEKIKARVKKGLAKAPDGLGMLVRLRYGPPRFSR